MVAIMLVVLEIYRITLLSNIDNEEDHAILVLEIYRITLLSNSANGRAMALVGFGDLQNYTTLKLHVTCEPLLPLFWRFTELHYSQTANQ